MESLNLDLVDLARLVRVEYWNSFREAHEIKLTVWVENCPNLSSFSLQAWAKSKFVFKSNQKLALLQADCEFASRDDFQVDLSQVEELCMRQPRVGKPEKQILEEHEQLIKAGGLWQPRTTVKLRAFLVKD